MAEDKEQQPESLLPYDDWVEAAMRQVVARALAHAVANGLPGEHHFYVTFRTDYPGVVIPQRLRAQYPQEMTIVLQHQFWDLKMDDEAGLIQCRPVVRRGTGGAGDSARFSDRICGSVRAVCLAVQADPGGRCRRGAGSRASQSGGTGRDAAGGEPRCIPSPPTKGVVARAREMSASSSRRKPEMNAPMPRPSGFLYSPMFPLGPDRTAWKQLPIDGVRTATCDGQTVLRIAPDALSELAFQAFRDVSHLLRPGHLASLRAILEDPEASANDRFVALDLLKNANIAAGGVLPMCQDTGTAIVFGKKGQRVWVDGDEEEALSWGVHRTYTETNLRYSQMAPLSMFEEVNTGNNLPVQFDIMAAPGEAHADEFHLMFVAKGGGSANKSFLFQETRAILSPERLLKFLDGKMRSLGTSACPPYHLAIVIGGTSAEMTLKTVKLASTRWLDTLPTVGSKAGHAIRDLEMEQQVLELSRTLGIGAQFGGKYFCHDVRVIRLPRHGASLPVGIGVSCSADRQVLAKITPEGVFLEQLETDPAKYLPETTDAHLGDDAVAVDLNRPMAEIRRQLSAYPVKTRLMLTGTMVVARDIAHAKLQERLDRGEGLPDYIRNHPVYYAGPGQDPDRICHRQLRPNDGGTDGQLRRGVPGRRRLTGDAGEGQSLEGGARCVQGEWRVLSRQCRGPRCTSRTGLHPQGRGAGISRTRHGSGMAHRGGELPGVHRDR